MIFPPAAALTVVLNGKPVRSYNAPYVVHGRVMAPIEPFVTSIATEIRFDGSALIARLGDYFAQVPMRRSPLPQQYAQTYVAIGPIVRTLGAQIRYDAHTHIVYVRTPPVLLALPTPFNPAVPRVAPSIVFTPSPVQTPRPTVTGTPLPRRTPIPAERDVGPTPLPR